MTEQLAIRLTADADDATRALDGVGDAAQRMASTVDTAVAGTDAAASRLDGVADSADEMASKSSQAAGGLGDLGGALAMMPGPLGAVGAGMEAVAPAIMGVTGAADLVNLAMNQNVIANMRARAATIATTVATRAQSVATRAAAIAQRVMNAAMRANPIGLVITAVMLLVGAVVLAYKRSETFRRIIDKAMAVARAAIGLVIDKVGQLVGWLRDKLPAGAVWARDKAVAAWTAIKDKAGAAWDKIKNGFDTVKTKLETVGRNIKNAVTPYFEALAAPIEAAIDLVQDLIGWIKDIDFPKMPDLTPWNGRMMARDTGDNTRLSRGSLRGPAGGGDTYTIHVNGALDPDAVARQLDELLRKRARRVGKTRVVWA